MIKTLLKKWFSQRTLRLVRFDLLRMRTRWKGGRNRGAAPPSSRLHLGCGHRKIAGWHNVDLVGSDQDVDLGAMPLPWPDASFDTVVSQHVIEHLEIESEGMPLFRELHRVVQPGGEVWLSCPDLEKVCRTYLSEGMDAMVADRQTRFPNFSLRGMPSSQMVNELFHQGGEHKNLFDFSLLSWCLEQAGFANVRRVVEADLLTRFPDFPQRNDDAQSLYVTATRGESA